MWNILACASLQRQAMRAFRPRIHIKARSSTARSRSLKIAEAFVARRRSCWRRARNWIQECGGMIPGVAVASKQSLRLDRTWCSPTMPGVLIAGATLALAGTALADSSQTAGFSGSSEIYSPPRSAASPGLDSAPRRITISGRKLTIPAIASAEQSQYGQLFTLIELLNISDADADLSFELRDASGNPLEMPFYNVAQQFSICSLRRLFWGFAN